MKIVFVLFVCVFSITDIERALIEQINSDPEGTWKAKEYPDHLMKKFKAGIRSKSEFRKNRDVQNAVGRKVDMDSSFDARTVWGDLILPVRDQVDCGGWAFAVAESVGDRIGINTGKSQGVFSPQDLISCDTDAFGCNGSEIDLSWNWVLNNGIALESCISFVSGQGDVPRCPTTCDNGSEIVRTKVKSVRPVSYVDMQQELADNGPYEVAFDIFIDFFTYQSGIYKKINSPMNTFAGSQTVLLSGWGVEGITPYWICQNSWGDDWGESGYFRIGRGRNECGIEDLGYEGLF